MSMLGRFLRTPLGWLLLLAVLIWLFIQFKGSFGVSTGDNAANVAASISPVIPTGGV